MDWRARLELSSDSFTPLYAQLADRLREACRDLPSGTLMPSETELMSFTGSAGRPRARRSGTSSAKAWSIRRAARARSSPVPA